MMTTGPRISNLLAAAVRRPVAWADARFNALYGWRFNPLYHSGVLTVSLLAVVIVTGVYLLLFYRVGAPWVSVERITERIVAGRFIRGLHRYASDGALVMAVIHMARMYMQRRSWGPRALAWVSGLVLLFVLLVCGWTGYVMVWDVQGVVLAREGARWLDALPLFSEPIGRTFDGEQPVPNAFFFINLFAHAALPLGMGLGLWIHISRVARPLLVAPRGLLVGTMALLSAAALALPVTMAPAADSLRLPGPADYDMFYSFFLPLTMQFGADAVWLVGGVLAILVTLVPLWSRPRKGLAPPPSFVDEARCTGCEQCYFDCPYEAIAMVPRAEPGNARSAMVAHVDSSLCTSCGICAGSCAPMGVGPPGRTGRDQLARVQEYVAAHPGGADRVVIVACERGAGGITAGGEFERALVYGVSCSGNLHSSVVEYFVRAGLAGVLIVACPPRDCWNREGSKWLEQRLYHDREAELQERVDRRRVRLVYAAELERPLVSAALAAFRTDLAALDKLPSEESPGVERECDTGTASPTGVAS